jgi:flagellar biosynthesis/type III secretory pathway chaperone
MTQPFLSVIENTLAAELRVTQTIASLTENERVALQKNDLNALAELASKKEAQMGELVQIEQTRSEAVAAYTSEHKLADAAVALRDEMLTRIDRTAAQRIKVLRDGVQAYVERTRSLNTGNRALLQVALDRNAALREFLLQLVSAHDTYGPRGDNSVPNRVNHFMDWAG